MVCLAPKPSILRGKSNSLLPVRHAETAPERREFAVASSVDVPTPSLASVATIDTIGGPKETTFETVSGMTQRTVLAIGVAVQAFEFCRVLFPVLALIAVRALRPAIRFGRSDRCRIVDSSG